MNLKCSNGTNLIGGMKDISLIIGNNFGSEISNRNDPNTYSWEEENNIDYARIPGRFHELWDINQPKIPFLMN
jgi:hypothetical protein